MNRRNSKLVLALLVSCALASGCLIDRIGGAFSKEPEKLPQQASAPAQTLIEQALSGIDPMRRVDHHTHVLAIGTSVPGAFVNPKMRAGVNLDRIKFWIYKSAAGIRNDENADEEYLARLLQLVRAAKAGRYRILAFDKHYNPDGTANLAKTTMYIPNEYIVELARRYPDVFLPVISVHPYRRDALQELEKWAKAGMRYLKWLPNAMGMDPADPAIEPFYKKMREYKMVLLSHAGEEQAVEAEEDQRLGNPLRLRKPLDLGVRVIVAHAASLGECADHDDAGAAGKTDCFELFLRLMDEPKYAGLLFGEISAMLQFNRMPVPLATLLKRQDLHSRLVDGSDYPLPAINALIHTRSLARDGFITAEERQALNEIYDYNPLLFDFVLKRTIRHPETKQKLAPSIFMANPGLEN
jgi:predicted TIM-barrel fold metal-dependent hydrolase